MAGSTDFTYFKIYIDGNQIGSDLYTNHSSQFSINIGTSSVSIQCGKAGTTTWNYSGSGTFLGLSTAQGATTPDSDYEVGDTKTITVGTQTTFYFYSVEGSATSNDPSNESDTPTNPSVYKLQQKTGDSTAVDLVLSADSVEHDTAVTSDSSKLITSGAVATSLATKQDTLVSGTNIKTINNESLLGSGNIEVEGGSTVTVEGEPVATFSADTKQDNTVNEYGYTTEFISTDWKFDSVPLNGKYIWTLDNNIYYSSETTQLIFNKETLEWERKDWYGLESFYGDHIWTDGENIYYSSSSTQYVLNKETSTWAAKTWTGLTNFNGDCIWTDGSNIYYSSGSTQYVLNKATSTWSTKTWTGLTSFSGSNIWTYGDNIYFSATSNQYVLNKATSTWSTKTWTGINKSYFYGSCIWTDGNNIYHSYSTYHYVLNKDDLTWSTKAWSKPGSTLTQLYGYYFWTDGNSYYYSDTDSYIVEATNGVLSAITFEGSLGFTGQNVWTDGDNTYVTVGSRSYIFDQSSNNWKIKTWIGNPFSTSTPKYSIWTDGENIYYSSSSTQKVLDKSTSTWTTKTWAGLTSFSAYNVWMDGNNIYYSSGSTQYVLDKSTSTWSEKTWSGLTSFYGQSIWTDGINIYYSSNGTNKVLNSATSTWSTKSWTGYSSISGMYVWHFNNNTYYSSSGTYKMLDSAGGSNWSTISWSGLDGYSFSGYDTWTLNGNLYVKNRYKLERSVVATKPFVTQIISDTSREDQVPSAKCVYDSLEEKQSKIIKLHGTYSISNGYIRIDNSNITLDSIIIAQPYYGSSPDYNNFYTPQALNGYGYIYVRQVNNVIPTDGASYPLNILIIN